jgi:aryl-alcohol dehydrogenase-like predicted oxidoreductase
MFPARHRIPNTNLDVSGLCYGVMQFNARVRGADMHELYRCFREAGGNFFDTAHCYNFWMTTGGPGESERGLGECLAAFDDRDQIVIATKGGHPDFRPQYPRPDDYLSAEVIASDVTDSLERLGIETIDLYLLHRDDPRRSVASIMDMLNEQVARGHVRYLGASNWTIPRIEEANDYAASHGLVGFVIAQQQWSLALSNLPYPLNLRGPDPTCYRLNDADVEWHRSTGFPVMAYTATAFGYFGESPGKNAPTYDNLTSQARRERARQLGQELGGFTANQIALAYLLSHPFPVYPILGTMHPEHLADAMGALAITLTPEQRDWLHG